MSTHEGDEPVEGERPAEDAALASAVDDAMKREVWRALAPQFQHLTFESRRVQPPRDRDDVDDILEKLRNQNPDVGPRDGDGRPGDQPG